MAGSRLTLLIFGVTVFINIWRVDCGEGARLSQGGRMMKQRILRHTGHIKAGISHIGEMQTILEGRIIRIDKSQRRLERRLDEVFTRDTDKSSFDEEMHQELKQTLDQMKGQLRALSNVIRHATQESPFTKNGTENRFKNISNGLQKITEELGELTGQSHGQPPTNLNDIYLQMVKLSDRIDEQQNSIASITSSVNAFKSLTKATESCYEYRGLGATESGIYKVTTRCININVFCDMETEGGGWTVFQRRVDGSEDFYRTWDEYKFGFGKLSHEFWLGNEFIHLLTSVQGQLELRIDMEDRDGNWYLAQYSNFRIGPEVGNYTLTATGFSGNISRDALAIHTGEGFATKDRDNFHMAGCAKTYGAAWWYRRCYSSNLNGMYSVTSGGDGVVWYIRPNSTAVPLYMKRTVMKFRNRV